MIRTFLIGIAALFLATSAQAQYCSSWQICAYRARHPELYSKWGILRERALPRDEQILVYRNYQRASIARRGMGR